MECSGNKNYSKAIIIIFIIAALYTVLPDLVPGPVDDAAVDGVAGIIIIILKSIEAGSKSVARDFVINNRDELKDAVKSKLKNEQAKEQLDNCSDFINHAYDAKSSENIDQIQNNLNVMQTNYRSKHMNSQYANSSDVHTVSDETSDMNLF